MDQSDSNRGIESNAVTASSSESNVTPYVTPASATMPTAQVARDRIVILGRTQAGKTIFLAALYQSLWQELGELSVRGIDGRTHKACMEIIDTLRSGQWPSSTVGSKYLDMEVRFKGTVRPLVSLDYPGEAFRRAFVDGARGSDVDELLDHVDRAIAVIALLDPAVVTGKSLTTAADDEFGMFKAIERIRHQAGGREVPVVLVLTKYDIRHKIIKAAGGLSAFVKANYAALAQTAPNAKVFTCSAVQQTSGSSGPVVAPEFQPSGVVAPLRHIVLELDRIDHVRQQREQHNRAQKLVEVGREMEENARRRGVMIWAIGWGGFIILFCVCGLLAWWLSHD